jgi:CRISPR-associated protein Cas5h
MQVLKFRLWGRTAFFKKPDVNTYLYFTYGNIHKVALLGLLGAVVGYSGYNQFDFKKRYNKEIKNDYPEFYERLQYLKVAIEPTCEGAVINKKVQVFNNSSGYYNKDKAEKPCNLIVKEQWLENPSWNIYIIIDNEEAEKVADYILNNKVVYQPYLGKNDHYANISEVELYEDCIKVDKVEKINSLCFREEVILSLPEQEWGSEDEAEEVFKYSESLPFTLNKDTNLYEMKSFVYSNMNVEGIKSKDIYRVKNKNIVFF